MRTSRPPAAPMFSNGGLCSGLLPSPGSVLLLDYICDIAEAADPTPPRAGLTTTESRCLVEIPLLSIIMTNKSIIPNVSQHVSLAICPRTSIVTSVFNHPRMHPCHNTIITLKCPLHMLAVSPVSRVATVEVLGLMSVASLGPLISNRAPPPYCEILTMRRNVFREQKCQSAHDPCGI